MNILKPDLLKFLVKIKISLPLIHPVSFDRGMRQLSGLTGLSLKRRTECLNQEDIRGMSL